MSVELKIESGVQLLARLTRKPNIENFYPALFQSGPISGDIIEIFSNTNTSHLLVDIISEALIRTKNVNSVPAGVLIFDTDGNLNYDEIVKTIKRKTCDTEVLAIKEINNEVHDTLANLHILNIYDATQFYTTIYNLETILVDHPNISLIIFNTLTAFYWSEQGYKITKMDLYTKSLINIIQKITKEHKTICIYTRPEYFCTNKESENIPTEINYQIQLLDNDKGNNQVNIKTADTKLTKFCRVLDGGLRWI